MSFKKGDWVYINHNLEGYQDDPGLVSNMKKYYGTFAEVSSGKRRTQHVTLEGNVYTWDTRWLSLVIKNSKLNNKLYPTYVECKGYLVPPKIADQIIEQSSHGNEGNK